MWLGGITRFFPFEWCWSVLSGMIDSIEVFQSFGSTSFPRSRVSENSVRARISFLLLIPTKAGIQIYQLLTGFPVKLGMRKKCDSLHSWTHWQAGTQNRHTPGEFLFQRKYGKWKDTKISTDSRALDTTLKTTPRAE